jgi:putative ABC transport system ATP-binding protein
MIEVRNIDFVYRSREFRLQVPRLSVQKGEKVALTGPSGTGKTTLLNLLAGILTPSAGTIEIDGLNISDLPVEDRQDFRIIKMGLVFQEFGLLEYLTVFENICLPYRITPVLAPDHSVLEQARKLAEAVGLGDKLHRYPKHLSQGERQRIEVCRALVTRPALVLGDEPTGNLDPGNRDRVSEMLFRYSAETGAPLVVVTHDYELVGRFDRRVEIQDLNPQMNRKAP